MEKKHFINFYLDIRYTRFVIEYIQLSTHSHTIINRGILTMPSPKNMPTDNQQTNRLKYAQNAQIKNYKKRPI